MNDTTANRLIELNRNFYDRFGAEFSATRRSIPKGIERAVASLGGAKTWLDVGCGDGRVGRYLQHGTLEEPSISAFERYVGIDASPRLLGIAQSYEPRGPASPFRKAEALRFVHADLTTTDWPELSEVTAASPFTAITCFAVLFHLPGVTLRTQLLLQLRRLVAPNGRLALSVWQILHHEALSRKVVPWSEAGLAEDDVDAGDLLVTWNQGGRGLRYVHHFHPDELDALCRRTGWEIQDGYAADGRTGDLSLFRILVPA